MNLTAEQIKTMKPAEILAIIQAQAAALAAKNKITFKVSEKGALSVYGLNARFPVTLYAPQWERLFEQVPAMQEFIKANEGKLSREKKAD